MFLCVYEHALARVCVKERKTEKRLRGKKSKLEKTKFEKYSRREYEVGESVKSESL